LTGKRDRGGHHESTNRIEIVEGHVSPSTEPVKPSTAMRRRVNESSCRPSLLRSLTLPARRKSMGDKRHDGRTDAVGEEEKKVRRASKPERRESEGDKSPESGPMGTDHEPAPGGPMGTEDKHEEEAESRVGEEEND
jgi:hypothetical protein